MKAFTLLQTTKQHNVNQLHDAFITAGITPLSVESSGTESTATFDDSVTNAQINAVIAAYVFVPPLPPVDLVLLGQRYRAAVTAATTLAQCKAVLNGELWDIIKAFAKRDVNL